MASNKTPSQSIKQIIVPALLLCGIVAAVLMTRPKLYHFDGNIMGTTYNVSYVSTLFDQNADTVAKAVHAALSDVDRRMSTYKPDSELMQFNRSPIGKPFTVSPDLVALVAEAESVSKLSSGAYDITIGPLVNLWGFGPKQYQAKAPSQAGKTTEANADHHTTEGDDYLQWLTQAYPNKIPSAAEIDIAKAKVGYQSLSYDLNNNTLTRHKDAFVDLSSIAKGYGVDQAAKAIETLGIHDFMVEVGGEVLVSGQKSNGLPWRLAVIGPNMGEGGVSALVEPMNKALATSGDYLNYFEMDGKRYSHTINPVTGYPEAKRIAEVAVIADTTAKADALATMFMVLGDNEGLALANRLGIAARFAYYTETGFETVTSEAFRPYLVK